MYRHILIPRDASDLAERGVAHGLELAKSVGAKVSLIYVVEPLLAVTGEQVPELFFPEVDFVLGIELDLAHGPVPDSGQVIEPARAFGFLRFRHP